MTTSTLSKFLVNPTKVASILNWKKAHASIMCLNVNHSSIGVAIARHPHCEQMQIQDYDTQTRNENQYRYNNDLSTQSHSFNYHDMETMGMGMGMDMDANIDTPILYNLDMTLSNPKGTTQKEQVKEELPRQTQRQHLQVNQDNTTMRIHQTLESIVIQYQVCAFLIHWPLSIHGCRMGESCGRVLYTLDKLVAANDDSSSSSSSSTGISDTVSSSIFSKNRPFALISLDPQKRNVSNDNNPLESMVIDKEDMWGRNANLSRRVDYNPQHSVFSSKHGVTFAQDGDNGDSNDNDSANISVSSSPSFVASTALNQFLTTYWAEDTNDMMEEEMVYNDFRNMSNDKHYQVHEKIA